MAALAGGVVALVLGLITIIAWWGEFIDLLQGAIPVMLILGGALAAYLGLEEIKDKTTSESFDSNSGELKDEVQNLKDEIKGLKEEKKQIKKQPKSTDA